MRWILFGLAAAAFAASMAFTPTARVRGDNYGWQEPVRLDDEAGGMTLTLCEEGDAC